MLKKYLYKGKEWQFEEGKQPAGAVEVKTKKPTENKAKKAVKTK